MNSSIIVNWRRRSRRTTHRSSLLRRIRKYFGKLVVRSDDTLLLHSRLLGECLQLPQPSYVLFKNLFRLIEYYKDMKILIIKKSISIYHKELENKITIVPTQMEQRDIA